MDCSAEERKGAVIAAPTGRIDEATCQDFAACLIDGVAKATNAQAKKLIIDFSGVRYMSSRGLRALTSGKREADLAGVTIVLAAANEIIREILAISRYDRLFVVAKTVEAALQAPAG
jgi:anti-anti-sigma factor